MLKCALLMSLALAAAAQEPAIANIGVNQARVARYQKFEITFDASGSWSNPFDPDQVAIDAIFQTPDGAVKTMPAFYFQDYQRTHENGRELLTAIGKPVWKVRFS